jgi:hypothetical protein
LGTPTGPTHFHVIVFLFLHIIFIVFVIFIIEFPTAGLEAEKRGGGIIFSDGLDRSIFRVWWKI